MFTTISGFLNKTKRTDKCQEESWTQTKVRGRIVISTLTIKESIFYGERKKIK